MNCFGRHATGLNKFPGCDTPVTGELGGEIGHESWISGIPLAAE